MISPQDTRAESAFFFFPQSHERVVDVSDFWDLQANGCGDQPRNNNNNNNT